MMPLPNEHSARLQDPKKFNPETFRRKDNGIIYGRIKVPRTIAVIWGKLKGKDKPSDNPIPQALRFPTKYWSVEKAKKWLKDNNIKYIRFEPAKPAKKEKGKSDAESNIFALIAELETQFWAMEPRALQGLFSQLAEQQIYIPDDITIEGQSRVKTLNIKNATAVIEIKGVLLREVPRAFDFWGIEATSYDQITCQVIEAVASDKVKDILLQVDSPGGAVPGVLETSEIIRAARDKKPINAVMDEIGTSCAYWLASQADHIEAEPNSIVGGIGVFSVYVDSSKRAEDMGLKVHVIRSAEHKGMGIPGAEITETQIAAIQSIADGMADNFVGSVAAGRKREKKEVRQWATGQSWLADKAVKMGLIDKISANESVKKIKAIKEKSMDSEEEKIDAQTEVNKLTEDVQSEERKRMAELRSAFPDDLDFALQAYEKGLTVDQAKAEHHDILQEQIKEAAGKEAAEKKAAEEKTGQQTGAKAIATEGSDGETQGDFMLEARKMVADGNAKTLTEAMRKVRRQHPELHEAFKANSEVVGKAGYNELVA